MWIRQKHAVKGIVGGGVLLISVIVLTWAARRARTAPPGETAPPPGSVPLPVGAREAEEPRFLPNELLATFTVPPGVALKRPDLDRLLAQTAKELGIQLGLIEDQPLMATAPAPLTVRVSSLAPMAADPNVHVKTIVDGINTLVMRSSQAAKSPGGPVLKSAMPNWIISNAPVAWAGGPGGLPVVPARDGDWRFEVPAPLAWPADAPPPDPPVVVAVLDTWPNGLGSASYPNNKALQRFRAHWGATGKMESLLPPPTLAAIQPPHPSEDFVDHGLFVAGIINNIAPHARLHVFQVLDDRGFTSTDRVLTALDRCLELARCKDGSRQRLVVNMSLYMLIPPEDLNGGLYAYWTGYPNWSTSGTAQPMTPQQAESVRALHQELAHRISLLLEAGAVVVAAAGNDALTLGEGRHLQPRLPADYPNLICAVATDKEAGIARYSNAPNPPGEGPGVSIATWGGQAEVTTLPQGAMVLGRASQAAAPAVQSDASDAVVGLCTVPTVHKAGDNTSGWIYWSGTSFATPILSAVAANVLARNPSLDPCAIPEQAGSISRQVQQEILKSTRTAKVGCPYLPVKQVST